MRHGAATRFGSFLQELDLSAWRLEAIGNWGKARAEWFAKTFIGSMVCYLPMLRCFKLVFEIMRLGLSMWPRGVVLLLGRSSMCSTW